MMKRQESIQFIRNRPTHFQYGDILDASAELVHVLKRYPNAQYALAMMARESGLYAEAMASIEARKEEQS